MGVVIGVVYCCLTNQKLLPTPLTCMYCGEWDGPVSRPEFSMQ